MARLAEAKRGAPTAVAEPQHRRLRGPLRREEIVRATRDLVAVHGIQGATTARISTAMGITEPALYKYFDNKQEMLIAAHDLLAARVLHWIDWLEEVPAQDRLARMGETHARFFSEDIAGFNQPMFQFTSWLPADRVREHVEESQRNVLEAIARLIEKGKAAGEVGEQAESTLVALEIRAWMWWEDLAYLQGLRPRSIGKWSAELFGRILQELAPVDGRWFSERTCCSPGALPSALPRSRPALGLAKP